MHAMRTPVHSSLDHSTLATLASPTLTHSLQLSLHSQPTHSTQPALSSPDHVPSTNRYVPKCFKVTRNGGTDGDALDPDFSFEKHGAEFGPWMKESSPAEHIDELVDKVRCAVLRRGWVSAACEIHV
jgi:hypothetical protein